MLLGDPLRPCLESLTGNVKTRLNPESGMCRLRAAEWSQAGSFLLSAAKYNPVWWLDLWLALWPGPWPGLWPSLWIQ